MNYTRYATVAGMILVAAGARLLPHPWNFTPVGAMALFGGAHFGSKRVAFLVPLCALSLSQLVLGLHKLMPFVYGSFLLTVCLGFWVRRRPGPKRVVIASVLSSTVFFLVTNFGVWAMLGTFPDNLAGLLECYVVGLPLYGNSLLGDLLYSGVLFGGLALATTRFGCLQENKMAPASTGAL